MAPEQINGDPVDRRTDVYALGVLLYELLTGHVPFAGSTPLAVTQAHLDQPPPTFVSLDPRSKVSAELEQVARRALAKDPKARWESAGALYAALLNATSSMARSTVPSRPAPRTVPVRHQSNVGNHWGRLVLLLPLVALLIGGLIVARMWSQTGASLSDTRLATIETDRTRTSDVAGAGVPIPTADANNLIPTSVEALPTFVPIVVTAVAVATSTIPNLGDVRGQVVAPDGAYLREGPGTAYAIVAGLPDGVSVSALQQADGWLEIDADSGEHGWIAQTLVAMNGTVAGLPTVFPIPTVPPTAVPTAEPPSVVELPTVESPSIIASPTPVSVLATTVAIPGGEIDLEDTSFTGGFRNSGASIYGGRTSTWVYGQGSGYERMSASFTVQGVRSGMAMLVIEGMDSEDNAKTPLSIAVNNVVIFEGASPFPNDDIPLQSGVWDTLRLPFDTVLLQDGANVVSLTNLASGSRGLPPFVAVDYAIVQLP